MALIVEDGSLVVGANSYVTVAEVRAFASARASVLPDADVDVETAAVAAMDFLLGREETFQGRRISAEQVHAFPRYDVRVHGFELSSSAIPATLKDAQCQLIIEVSAGVDLLPSNDGRVKISEKIDVLETEWTNDGGNPAPSMRAVEVFLKPLLRQGGALTVTRI